MVTHLYEITIRNESLHFIHFNFGYLLKSVREWLMCLCENKQTTPCSAAFKDRKCGIGWEGLGRNLCDTRHKLSCSKENITLDKRVISSRQMEQNWHEERGAERTEFGNNYGGQSITAQQGTKTKCMQGIHTTATIYLCVSVWGCMWMHSTISIDAKWCYCSIH